MKNWIDRLARWWLGRRPQPIPDTLVVPPGCRVLIEKVDPGTNVVNYGHVSLSHTMGTINQFDCKAGSSAGFPLSPLPISSGLDLSGLGPLETVRLNNNPPAL